jgi:hypothetical protein
LNHRHADFQSCVICGYSEASSGNTVKPTTEYQDLTRRLSNDLRKTEVNLSIVKEARETFGTAAARRLWIELGLPPAVVTDARSSRNVHVDEYIKIELLKDDRGSIQAAHFFEKITAWLIGRGYPTISRTAMGISLRAAGVSPVRRSVGVVYVGYRFRNQSPQPPNSSPI